MIPPASDPPTDPLDPIRRRLAAFRVLAETGDSVADQIAALEDQLRAAEYSAAATNSSHAQVVAGNNNVLMYIADAVSPEQRDVVGRWFNEYMLEVWTEHHSLALVGSRAGIEEQDRIPLGAVYTGLDVVAVHTVRSGNDGLEPDPPDEWDAIVPETAELRSRSRGTGWIGRVNEGDRTYHSVSTDLSDVDEAYGEALRSELRRAFDSAENERARRPSAAVGRDRLRWSRRATALEAAASTARRVIVGAPGSGKSTFARYLALCMAGAHLGRSEANVVTLNRVSRSGHADRDPHADGPPWEPWPHGVVLPVFVELRRFAADADAFPASEREASGASLLRHVESRVAPTIAAAFQPHFRGYLQDGKALFILDGLDEVAEAGARRLVIKRVIADLVERYPASRILLTSRPYAYAPGSPWRLDDLGFAPEMLADFDDDQIALFVQAWHGSIAARGKLPADRAERCRDALTSRLRNDAQLRPLAGRPLLLTMIADLNATANSLPSTRAGLYEESAKLLLDRWNETQDRIDDRPMSIESGLTPARVRAAIEALAYDVHRAAPSTALEAANIPRLEVLRAFARARGQEGDHWTAVDQRVLEYIGRRSGILVSEDEDTYRFPHRSFQEFMAACHLNKLDFPRRIATETRSAPAQWREVVQFVLGRQVRTSDVLALLRKLIPHVPDSHCTAADAQCATSFYAALGFRDSCLAEALHLGEVLDEDDAAAIERLRLWLRFIVTSGALPATDRAEAGRILAAFGDDRPGVHLRSDGVPDITWIALPGGTFAMGSDDDDPEAFDDEKPKQTVKVPPFRIAKYPITVAQYRSFVADHPERAPMYWDDAAFTDDNQPVVGVTWHDAIAFCAWLSERHRERVRLPTEAEWEYAARGMDGRIYPWGRDFDAERCNTAVSGILRTTAVGMYPLPDGYWTARPDVGEDPLDMSGNVWEWTSTRWRDQLDKPANDSLTGVASRVVRGGSWYGDPRGARSAYRYHDDPDYAWRNIGFRVAAPSS